MHTKAPFWRLKKLAGRVLFHPLVGRIISRACDNRISSGGFVFDVNSPVVSDSTKAALWWGRLETADCRFAKAYWRSDLDTLQLGSGLGVVASYLGKVLQRGRRLVCVETNPLIIRLLESNVTRNASHLRTLFLNAAIDYSGASWIDFRSANDFLSSRLAYRSDAPVCHVPAVTFSEIAAREMPQDFQLQMDIEGAEAGVFISESPHAFARCYQILAEFHETTYGGKHLTVQDLISIAHDVHRFELADRYGPVVLLRKRAPNYSNSGSKT